MEEARKGRQATNGKCSAADQKRSGRCTTFFGAAGVVVPTSLPKLLYRKLPAPSSSREKTLNGRVIWALQVTASPPS